MSDLKRYADLLRRHMLDNGLNQTELAARLGVTPGAVGKWLLGDNGISRRNRDKIDHLIQNQTEGKTEMEGILNFEQFCDVILADAKEIARIARKYDVADQRTGDYVLGIAHNIINAYRRIEYVEQARREAADCGIDAPPAVLESIPER